MTISAWWLLLIAIPVLRLGEQLGRRSPALSRVDMPVPVVGVFAGMIFLGERPGTAEFVALGLVIASLFAVLWAPQEKKPSAAPAAEPEM